MTTSAFGAAMLWLDRHFAEDPDPDVQALIQIIRKWQEAARNGQKITADFSDFVDGVLAERYGRPFPNPVASELAALVR